MVAHWSHNRSFFIDIMLALSRLAFNHCGVSIRPYYSTVAITVVSVESYAPLTLCHQKKKQRLCHLLRVAEQARILRPDVYYHLVRLRLIVGISNYHFLN